MAIGTYAQLQTAIGNWLDRADLTDRIPEFITLAESRLNRLLRMRLSEVNGSLTGTVSSRTITLPTTFAEPVNLWLVETTGRTAIDFRDPALLETVTANGRPRYWTVEGANLGFDCPCDTAYSFTLRYLAKYALSDSATTNTLLTNYPDLYLFGSLIEAAPYLRDADLLGLFEGKYQTAMAEVNEKENRSRSLQSLATEPAVMGQRRYGYRIASDQL